MATTTEPTYRPVLPILVGDRTLPEGCDAWAIRTVRADLTSSRGYRWPWPGQWADAPGPIIEANTDPCPSEIGDGICVAVDYAGMASGGVPARTLLLCAYATSDVLGTDGHKLRLRRAFVVEVLDGEAIARRDLTGADLTRANLTGADLTGADLTRANLTDADLTDANLARANLADAYLTRAYLTGANLTGANLTGAYLTRANLTRADLTDADLTGADLTGANLTRAYLTGANLTGANLTDAYLTGAYLTGAYLTGARSDRWTRWPDGFDPAMRGAVTP